MNRKTSIMRKVKQAAAVMISLAMCLSVPVATFADVKEADSKTIKLSKIVGTVLVNKGTKAVPKVTEGMRMHDGHTVVTDKESNAFFELDASKYIKMDQVSKVKVQKNKDTNKIMVESGTVFFNVTQPLSDDETMEIKTPTITMGVRGTSGVVGFQERNDDNDNLFVATVQIYTGLGSVTVGSEIDGEGQVYSVAPGTQILVTTNITTGAVKVEAGTLELNGTEIPTVASEELLQNEELRKEIEHTTGIKITEDMVQKKKAEEDAQILDKEAGMNKDQESIKQDNKDYGHSGSSGDKSGNNTPSKPTEPNKPIEPEEPEDSNVLTGEITDEELLEAFEKSDQVIVKNGRVTLDGDLTIPSGKILILEENGTLDLNGFNLTLLGEIINNSLHSIELKTGTLRMGVNARLTNNGAITAENEGGTPGRIQVYGTGVYIKNTAGKVIPHIAITATGHATIENENGDVPGKIRQLTGEAGGQVQFNNTGNSSVSNYSEASNCFKDGFGAAQADITFEEEYSWAGADWKLDMPADIILAKDHVGELAAAIEAKFSSGSDSIMVVCGETINPDVLERNLTIPEDKKLIIVGSPSGGLALDSTNINIINNGIIEIGTADRAGELQEAGTTPGNIDNQGDIVVKNGKLVLNDNGITYDTALDGKLVVNSKGTIGVYVGAGEGPYWGYISGDLELNGKPTVDLKGDGTNTQSLVFLDIIGTDNFFSCPDGYTLITNNSGSIFSDNWKFEGEGEAINPYKLTKRDLNKFRKFVASPITINEGYAAAHYELVPDDNPSVTPYAYSADGIALSSNDWIPIGTAAKPFKGGFDGNNVTISGVVTAKVAATNVGFFGVISGATVKNLTLKDVDIYGKTCVGGIAGQAKEKSVISNCSVSGVINGTTSAMHTGGIAGLLTDSTIERCVNTANITANTTVGGIAGKIQTGASITECYNRGSINANGNSSGGLIGEAMGGNIENCYSEGAIDGENDTGGIVGYIPASNSAPVTVTYTYNRGAINGSTSVGGIVGRIKIDSGILNDEKIVITNNAFLGSISGDDDEFHRIVGGYTEPTKTFAAVEGKLFTVEENYGIGTSSTSDEEYEGEDEADFDSYFWSETIRFSPSIWSIVDGLYPTLTNIPDGQAYETMTLMALVDGAEIEATTNRNAIAASIEKAFEDEDTVTLIFKENESADLEKNLTVPEGKTLKILGTSLENRTDSSGLNVPKGITLTNDGTIEIGTEYEEGIPMEKGVLSQGAVGKNTIINNGIIDVKQGIFRISADEEDTSGISGEIIVGQELSLDDSFEEPLAVLMVYSGNSSEQTYWGKIDGNLTVHDNGKIDLFHENEKVTVNLLLLTGASITENGEDSVYTNSLSDSKVIFEEDLPDQLPALPETEDGVEDGDVTDGDITGGEGTDEDITDGDVTDGDVTDGEGTDGDITDGDVTDGDVTNGDVTDGDVTDGDATDGDVTDGSTTEEDTAAEDAAKTDLPIADIPEVNIPDQKRDEGELEGSVQ